MNDQPQPPSTEPEPTPAGNFDLASPAGRSDVAVDETGHRVTPLRSGIAMMLMGRVHVNPASLHRPQAAHP